jgi:hypothetical protein
MGLKALTWQQVNAWRLSQHCLAPRLQPRDFIQAASRAGGLQAQVMSAAELALWARVDGLAPQDVQAALWQERSLVKTWMMRAALHLFAADELPLYVAARSRYPGRNWLKYFTYFGITPAQYEAFLAAVPQVLGDEPLTRAALAEAVAAYLGDPELGRKLLASSWGSLWKPSALRGELCFGPNRNGRPTFVNPRRWLGEPRPVDSHQALQEIARRYLRAYGPARPEDFARWWELGLVPTRKLFQSLAVELEEVELEGRPAFALREMLDALPELAGPEAVNLLPLFDAYVLGIGRDLEPILPSAYKHLVYRPQGWISAVVLVGGRMAGVWEYRARGAETIVKIQLFTSPTPTAPLRRGLEAEAERLSAFWNTRVALVYGGDG